MTIKEVEERGCTFDKDGRVIDSDGNEYRDKNGRCVIFKSKAVGHEYVCDECGKPATINLQRVWKKWRITKNGNFVIDDEWCDDSENNFWCDYCEE